MTDRTRKLIAGYELACAAWVVVALGLGAVLGPRQGNFILLVLSLGFAAVASGAAGWLLWRNHPTGRLLSLVVQGLQSVGLSVPGFAFALRLGFAFDVTWRAKGAASWPHVFILANFGPHDEAGQLSVNILAAIVFLRLLSWKVQAQRPSAPVPAAAA